MGNIRISYIKMGGKFSCFSYVFDDNASEFQVFVHKMLYFNCDLAVTNHFRGFLKIQGKGKKTVFFLFC